VSEPVRVQVRRTPGFKLSRLGGGEPIILVGRGTKYGNPFLVKDHGRDGALRLYREYLRQHPELIELVRRELAGKSLACWCRVNEPCHGDVLLEIAAGGQP